MVLQRRAVTQTTEQPSTLPADRRQRCTTNDKNKRGEIKLTGTVAHEPHDSGRLPEQRRERAPTTRALQSFIIDPHSEVDRSNPNWYYFTNYRGVLRQQPAGRGAVLAAQVRVRRRRRHQHGHRRLAVHRADQCACLYNAPYFDATDPENRNNRQLTGNVDELLERRRAATRSRPATSSSAASAPAATRSRRRRTCSTPTS